MSFFKKCPRCRNMRFHIAHRKYKTEKMGVITSNEEICRTCYNLLKPLTKNL